MVRSDSTTLQNADKILTGSSYTGRGRTSRRTVSSASVIDTRGYGDSLRRACAREQGRTHCVEFLVRQFANKAYLAWLGLVRARSAPLETYVHGRDRDHGGGGEHGGSAARPIRQNQLWGRSPGARAGADRRRKRPKMLAAPLVSGDWRGPQKQVQRGRLPRVLHERVLWRD